MSLASSQISNASYDRFANLVEREPAIGNLLHGPEIDPHLVTFDPKQAVIPEVGYKDLYRRCGIIPAAILRNYLLCYGSKDDERLGELKFDHMVSSLSQYATLISDSGREQCPIFKYYYGLLCVRSLACFTCVAILRATNTLANVTKRVESSMTWNDAFNMYALAALNEATRAIANAGAWHNFCGIFSNARFISDIRARATCVEAMLKMLSLSRESLYTLHTRGLLPGCSLMLLAVSAMLPKDANMSGADQGLHALEDLGFRLYIAGAPRDRQILQPVCMAAIERKHWMPDLNRLGSTEDNAVVCRAYCELVIAWKRDNINTKNIPVEFLTCMSSFALGLSLCDPTASMQGRIDVTRTSFDMLWMIFEDGRQVPLSKHNALRNYAGSVLSYLCAFNKDIPNEDQPYLAEMLTESDVIPLCGRILLLTTKGNNSHSTDHSFILLANTLEKLELLVNGLKPVSMELYKDFVAEVGKSAGRFGTWLEMDGIERHKDDTEVRAMTHLLRTLSVFVDQKNEPEGYVEYQKKVHVERDA
ncbi:hypothetical protein FRC07_001610 [Ceratobasidium sp. 392]|nr:hypothetical protein FRC07_001610 [Ceratobasidium sp. 392]